MDYIDWKKEIIRLLDKINDQKILRRVWKILAASINEHQGRR